MNPPTPVSSLPAERPRRWGMALALATALFLPAVAARATTVRQMDLPALIKGADRICRGTIIGIREGSVQAGGGTIPTITYRLQVADAIAGQPNQVIEFTTVGHPKAPAVAGTAVNRSPIQAPELKEGKEYLLFLTRPSRIGLSAMVGLGQGCFEVRKLEGKEFVINEARNLGLGAVGPGPVEYRQMVDKIRSLRNP